MRFALRKEKVIYCLLMAFESMLFYQGSNVLYVPGYMKVFICGVFFLMAYIVHAKKSFKKIVSISSLASFFSVNGMRYVMYLFFPYLLIFMYTVLLYLTGNLLDNQLSSAITMFGSITAGVILVPSTKCMFKDKGLYFWMHASIFCYTTIIIKSILDYGFDSIIHFIEYNEKCMSYLESHELIFIFGLFYIYLLLKKEKTMHDKVLFLIITTFIILGYKRITLAALLLITMIVLLTNKLCKPSVKVYRLINIFLFVVTSIYGYISSFGMEILIRISNMTGIDFMGRLQIMEQFNDCFDLRTALFGRGFMFPESYLESIMSGYAAAHNDVMRILLDIGIGGFVIFFVYIILYLHKKISMNNENILLFNEVILVYLLLHYATDNLMIYPRFFAVLCMTMLYYSVDIESDMFEKGYCSTNKKMEISSLDV